MNDEFVDYDGVNDEVEDCGFHDEAKDYANFIDENYAVNDDNNLYEANMENETPANPSTFANRERIKDD